MRFFSIATADSVLPQPTIASLDGAAIKRKYNNTQGSGWDGWVEVRIAVSEEKVCSAPPLPPSLPVPASSTDTACTCPIWYNTDRPTDRERETLASQILIKLF